MPGRQEVTGFTAGRRITMNGATYQPGDAVPLAVVRGLRRLSALVNRRMLIPVVEPFRRDWQRTVPGPADAKSLVIKDPFWSPSTSYEVSDTVRLGSEQVETTVEAVESGVSGTEQPPPPPEGETVIDNTVTWAGQSL